MAVLLPSCAFRVQVTPNSGFENSKLPRSISLCDEPIPLEKVGVAEMLDREFTIAVWDRAQALLWLKRAGRYFPHIEAKLAEEGLPDDLKYLAVVESALLTDIRSSKGALGLWQFMARTGRHYGLRKDRMMDERLDFERSTEAAVKYLRRLHEIFGSWALVLAAYNSGESFLKKEIRKQKVDDFYSLDLSSETKRFIFRITAIKIIMENPERYGYHLAKEEIYQPVKYDAVQVRIYESLHLADFALTLGTNYGVIKELNPQFLKYHLPTGRYMIRVPPGLGAKVATVLPELTMVASESLEEVADSSYVVRPGDTLSHIAKSTGVPVAILKRLNRIKNSIIRPGQMLQLSP
jgi:LysM repeat protein